MLYLMEIFIGLGNNHFNHWSARNSKESGHRMFKVYQEEYPVFKYALKVRNLYSDMWVELDLLNLTT